MLERGYEECPPLHGGLAALARIPGKLVILAPFGGKGFDDAPLKPRPVAAVLASAAVLAGTGADVPHKVTKPNERPSKPSQNH